MKQSPTDVKIYEYDHEPLGDRTPFLMVHGLRGEFYHYFRWQKVAEKLTKHKDFNAAYKIYMCRYSSLDRIETVLPMFKEAFNKLYEVGGKKPIAIMALSMGGNLTYEAFTDANIEPKVKMLFTMGTPFHGSPLFCKDWRAYTVYKRLSWPWSRIDHNLAFGLYFRKNPNLQKDLTWDNADGAIPDVGRFWSKLPFGPSGKLTIENTENKRLAAVNSIKTAREKLITYGGYIVNPYLQPRAKRYLENAFLYPLFLVSTSFPAHMAREHPVLEYLNRDIANFQVPKSVAKAAGTPFVFVMNDGITPVSSAIFLPPDLAKEQCVSKEAELEKIKSRLDVGKARVFRNVDHLTFIDGVRPVNPIQAAVQNHVKDEINPHEPQKEIFDWILQDIMAFDAPDTGKLAKKELNQQEAKPTE
ncbi:MAG: hypothetical protein BWY75_02639 [bacterium ADurb.Bin425]|nr:MAG: hypothetical protein BWY75_02639 [bacterium ADurb.Bin425]